MMSSFVYPLEVNIYLGSHTFRGHYTTRKVERVLRVYKYKPFERYNIPTMILAPGVVWPDECFLRTEIFPFSTKEIRWNVPVGKVSKNTLMMFREFWHSINYIERKVIVDW